MLLRCNGLEFRHRVCTNLNRAHYVIWVTSSSLLGARNCPCYVFFNETTSFFYVKAFDVLVKKVQFGRKKGTKVRFVTLVPREIAKWTYLRSKCTDITPCEGETNHCTPREPNISPHRNRIEFKIRVIPQKLTAVSIRSRPNETTSPTEQNRTKA